LYIPKICIVTTSLANGGAERFSAELSFLLTKLGFQVHILMTKDKIDYDYTGTIFNLQKELTYKENNFLKVKLLKAYLKKNQFTYIIDNRTRNNFFKELVLYKYIFIKSKVIPVVHSCNLKNYFPKYKLLAKIVYSKIYKIIAVSKEIENEIKEKFRLKNVTQIYNSIDISKIIKASNMPLEINENYILAYGRIDEKVKNYSLLIKAYKQSNLIKKGIKLIILGDGEDINFLKALADKLSLTGSIIFLSFTSNPFPYVKRAIFTVLTSRNEGFPMVLVESLACETPVISVDCKSGPKEIVLNEQNGLLVENYNAKALANAFDRLIDDKKLYLQCKQNTQKTIKHLEVNEISLKWKDLLNK